MWCCLVSFVMEVYVPGGPVCDEFCLCFLVYMHHSQLYIHTNDGRSNLSAVRCGLGVGGRKVS